MSVSASGGNLLSMKKTIAILAVLLIAVTLLPAAPFRFVFGDAGQHPEVLMGFIPTYIYAGAGYEGLTLIDGNTTSIQALIGGGIKQRSVWQDPVYGKVQYDENGKPSAITYDVIIVDWALRFEQGFLDSTVAGKDLITLGAQYEGKFEQNKTSMAKNKRDYKTLDDYLGGAGYDGGIYPDLKGNHRMLGTNLDLYVKFDMMEDRKSSADGFEARFDADWSPYALNSLLSGKADYYSLTLNLVGAKTVYQILANDGKNLFSITLMDRVNVNWTDGKAVPVYAQEGISLGRKVRGYNTSTYNTQFTVVNNFDVRFAGPDCYYKGFFPRVNVFFDLGYGTGKVFNTTDVEKNFLCSTGAQFTFSFYDFIDLGYQIAYLITGEKYTSYGKDFVTSITFFLDF